MPRQWCRNWKELKRREPVRPAGNECNRTVDYSPIAAGSLARSRADHKRPAQEVARLRDLATRAPGGRCGCSTHEWSQQARQPNTRPLKPVSRKKSPAAVPKVGSYRTPVADCLRVESQPQVSWIDQVHRRKLLQIR